MTDHESTDAATGTDLALYLPLRSVDTDVGTGHSARVSENDETVWRWHAAAELAPFSFDEASNGTERWAGGFAGDGSLVEVISLSSTATKCRCKVAA